MAVLRWYDDIQCYACGGRVNSWDKRVSKALAYKNVTCEACIAKEYDKTTDELRSIMEHHFGEVPCLGI